MVMVLVYAFANNPLYILILRILLSLEILELFPSFSPL